MYEALIIVAVLAGILVVVYRHAKRDIENTPQPYEDFENDPQTEENHNT